MWCCLDNLRGEDAMVSLGGCHGRFLGYYQPPCSNLDRRWHQLRGIRAAATEEDKLVFGGFYSKNPHDNIVILLRRRWKICQCLIQEKRWSSTKHASIEANTLKVFQHQSKARRTDCGFSHYLLSYLSGSDLKIEVDSGGGLIMIFCLKEEFKPAI